MSKFVLANFWWFFSLVLIGYITSVLSNTLYNNSKWIVTKNTLLKKVMGAESFQSGIQSLSHETLHLDRWHGFQEVISHNNFDDIHSININASLDNNGYIYVQFGRNDLEYFALRLSRNNHYPSSFLHILKSGEIIYQNPFKIDITPNTWYTYKIEFSNNTTISLIQNSKPIATFQYPYTSRGAIGFRGGYMPATIKYIKVLDKNSKILLYDDFSGYKYPIFLLTIFISLGIIINNIYFNNLVFLRTINCKVKPLVKFFIVFILILASVITYYFTDNYPRTNGLFKSYWEKKERAFLDAKIEEKTQEIINLKPKKTKRLIFIGTSQTWGSGATTEANTIVSIVRTSLNNYFTSSLKENMRYQVLNMSVPGVNSIDLEKAYINSWRTMLDPDIVCINLSNNDEINLPDYAKNLESIVKTNIENNIKTIFILEANSLEYPGNIRDAHTIMRNVSDLYHIPLLDLHTHLQQQKNAGIIWWDFVHLTDFGQRIAGEYIAHQLIKEL